MKYGLLFKPTSVLSLKAYSDVDSTSNVGDRKRTSGYCFYFGGKWNSKKQKAIAPDPTKLKYRAASQAATKVAWFRTLFIELEMK